MPDPVLLLAGGLLTLATGPALLVCARGRDGWPRALLTPFRAHLRLGLALGLLLLLAGPAGAEAGTGPLLLGGCGAVGLGLWMRRGQRGPPAPGMAGAGRRFTAIGYNALLTQADTLPAEAWLWREAPDLVLVVEATPPWRAARERLRPLFPHQADLPYDPVRRRWLHMLLLSRHPIASAGALSFPDVRRRVLQVVLDVHGTPLTCLGLHPAAPRRRRDWRQRDAYLAATARAIARIPGPLLVLGDLNATPADSAFLAFRAAAGLAALPAPATWPAWAGPCGIAIDHAFAKGGLSLAWTGAGPALGSDHRPLRVVGELAPGPCRPVPDAAIDAAGPLTPRPEPRP